jgi:hypothetical protein
MEEKQIHAIPLGPGSEPLLTGNECKSISEFQEKLFELSNKSFFQLCFGVFVLQSQEFKYEGILGLKLGCPL